MIFWILVVIRGDSGHFGVESGYFGVFGDQERVVVLRDSWGEVKLV